MKLYFRNQWKFLIKDKSRNHLSIFEFGISKENTSIWNEWVVYLTILGFEINLVFFGEDKKQ